MKKFNYIVRMMLVLVVTFMTFSGAALTAQAAGPEIIHSAGNSAMTATIVMMTATGKNERKDWEKNHKTSTQKDVDKANRKANIAIGVAAVATIIALTK